MCVPPKNGGKQCVGDSVIVKSCNRQKCPSVGNMLRLMNKNEKDDQAEEERKPLVKVAPFSSRPQRYVKCKIREGDAFLTNINPETKEVMKQPIRMLLNNNTLSIYSDDDYENKIYNFNLETSNLLKGNTFCCIVARDTYKAMNLCGFSNECGSKIKNTWTKQWLKDFELFKRDCRTKRQHTFIKTLMNGNLNDLVDNMSKKDGIDSSAIEKLKLEFANRLKDTIINAKEGLILDNFRKQQKQNALGRVMNMQSLENRAIKKEIDLENLVKNEEKEREEMEFKKIKKRIKKERKKKKCLKIKLKKRELDTSVLLDKRESENEINELKNQLQFEIQMKRNEMKRQILSMRKKARRKKAKMESQLNKLRTEMTKDLLLANKEGDIEFCKKR